MEQSAPRTRLETLFHDALDVPSAERSAFLAKVCGDDLELRDQVLALIRSFEQETGFLDTPVLENLGPSVSQMLCALGQVLGHYRILELIGQGGMGDVYLAEDTTLGRKVALKLLPLRLATVKATLARFWLEARTASALNHPNIMTVYEIGDEQGLHYIAAEYVEGSTVRQLLANGPLPVEQILNISLQVATGLMAAHAAGIIHRDIKPENIMVRPDGYVKILDFGLAKLIENGAALQTAGKGMATTPGILLGTVGYMSPEQARGLDLDERSDLFSLGTVIYEMATGKCPFTGKTPSDALSSILHVEPPGIALLPPELAQLVTKLLNKEPEKRYQNAEELIGDIKKIQQEWSAKAEQKEVAEAAPELPRHRARLFWRGALIAVSLILIAAATAIGFRFRSAGDGAGHRLYGEQPRWRFSCRVLLQAPKGQQDKEIVLPAKTPLKFAAGQRFRLYFTSSSPGYLYLLDQASEPVGKPSEFVTLFPSPTANGGSPLVPAGREIAVPQESWLLFDPGKDTEKLWMIWSSTDLAMLDALSKYANVHDQGRVPPVEREGVTNFLAANYKPEDLDPAAGAGVTTRGDSKIVVWRMDLEHD